MPKLKLLADIGAARLFMCLSHFANRGAARDKGSGIGTRSTLHYLFYLFMFKAVTLTWATQRLAPLIQRNSNCLASRGSATRRTDMYLLYLVERSSLIMSFAEVVDDGKDKPPKHQLGRWSQRFGACWQQ